MVAQGWVGRGSNLCASRVNGLWWSNLFASGAGVRRGHFCASTGESKG